MKTPEDNTGGSSLLSVSAIVPDPKNRKERDGEQLRSLAESIKTDGLLQPIVVRQIAPGKYMLVAGERRWRAHGLLKRDKIEARIVATGAQAPTASDVRKRAAENFQREDLTPIEEAQLFRELHVEHKIPQAEIAKIRGRGNQSTVANALRLLELPAEVQKLVQDGVLTRAHGVALVAWAKWPKVCKRLGELAVSKGASSKDLEAREVPFAYELVHDKLIVEIECYGYPEPKYVVPDAMKKDPDFVKGNYGSTWYCFAPEKWIPERDRQDKARAAKEAARKKQDETARATGGKTSQGIANQKKAKANKAARAQIAEAKELAFKKLGSGKDFAPSPLIVVVEAALDDYKTNRQLKDAATLAGIKLPKGSAGSNYTHGKFRFRYLHSLKPAQLLKLAAASVMLRQADEAHKYVWGVPEALQLVGGVKGGAK